MASARTVAWVERLAWICIYGGLFAVVLGIVIRASAPATGWSLLITGTVAVAAGVVLILVRSRLSQSPGAQSTLQGRNPR
jgi:hypothetical protein